MRERTQIACRLFSLCCLVNFGAIRCLFQNEVKCVKWDVKSYYTIPLPEKCRILTKVRSFIKNSYTRNMASNVGYRKNRESWQPCWGWSRANIQTNLTSPQSRIIVLPSTEDRTTLSSFLWTIHWNVTDRDRQTDLDLANTNTNSALLVMRLQTRAILVLQMILVFIYYIILGEKCLFLYSFSFSSNNNSSF